MEKIEKWISNNKDIEQELIRLRRHFHEHPEVGHPLPQTQEYIVKLLEMYGYENIIVNPGGSIEVLVGPHDKKILLLRSDMDALPLVEHTNLPFKSINGSMHACGHDMHASMMLMCAKLLKKNEKKLKGQIKIVFQPHEEGLVGCKMMIEDGVLKYPRVDAAVGLHVMPATEAKTGTIRTIRKAMTTASTIFEINITGKSSHGSMPEKGIDALRVAVHIYQQLQEIIPKEISMSHDDVLTIGIMNAGKAHNIIPEKAYMKCSLRSYRPDDQEYIMGRVNELVQSIASMYHAQAGITILQQAPSVYNDPALLKSIMDVEKDVFGGYIKKLELPLTISEDFGHITANVPSLFVTLAAGCKQDGYIYGLHNKATIFDEGCLMYGLYFLYNAAMNWNVKY